MKTLFCLLLFLTLVLPACASAAPSAPEARTLTVFAAASLTSAFTEIGRNFEAANPGVTLIFNFSGSQALRTQIEEGAPADVFASANTKEMDALVSSRHVDASAATPFVRNRLVVILPGDNPAGIASLEGLASPGLKLVLAAEEVPVGAYARQALDRMNTSFGNDFRDRVLANLVSNEENVKQVVAKVQLGEADAGVVYTSDAVAAPDLQTLPIPDDLNVVASYPIAPLAASPNADLTAAFIEYVLSDEGQAVLAAWGFAPPQ